MADRVGGPAHCDGLAAERYGAGSDRDVPENGASDDVMTRAAQSDEADDFAGGYNHRNRPDVSGDQPINPEDRVAVISATAG